MVPCPRYILRRICAVAHQIYRVLKYVPSYAYKFKAREALAETYLEYSIVSIGMFLDYWASPHIPSVLDPRKGTQFFIDLDHNFAAIPGDGERFMVFTHSTDAARFVVAMIDLPKWPRLSFYAGDRLTLKQFLDRAEATKGVKFEVHYDEVGSIEAGHTTLPPCVKEWLPSPEWAPMFSKMAMAYLRGSFDLDMSKCRNDLFPEIKPLQVQDVLDAWKGK
jgi:nucleoside-diphosphate-sugar epimerase